MHLSEQEMRDETGYQIAAYLARNLLKEGLITEDEYRVIRTKLLVVFPAIIGALLSQKQLAIYCVKSDVCNDKSERTGVKNHAN